jgi:hypothetical protein
MDIIAMSKEIIRDNRFEFESIHNGRDPRYCGLNWIDVDTVLEIHKMITSELSANPNFHNKIDLKYSLKHPLTDIEGIPKKTEYEKICLCAYLLGRCFVDCGAQTSATVFMLLCKLNKIEVRFNCGEIYDIFTLCVGPTIDFDKFYKHMVSHHLVRSIPSK